ncbi:DUF4388 domain-containing protein [candidate division CSSED10-310 bacterium]|uniref:DUF4388 domain-containing protein n=1 Tax=candidate division CSSED10-310 bacterium TaxID=2855610 RepID=A0ABV6YWJ7_UNCC1
MAIDHSDNNFFLVGDRIKKTTLSKKRPTTIGREHYNDVVLEDLMASRQHAVITWEKFKFVIKDLKSQNGIYVNDEKIETAHISHQDVIKIGITDIFVYYGKEGEIDTFLLKEKSRIASSRTIKVKQQLDFSDRGFSGDLTSLTMDDIVQVINQAQKTGMLLIKTSPDDRVAKKIYFASGDIVHALCGTETNTKAVIKILQLQSGTFEYVEHVSPPAKTISKSTMWLLMEAHRITDENKEPHE